MRLRNFHVHLVWATWDRMPLLTPKRMVRIGALISAKCEILHVEVIEIGYWQDHIHLLVRYPATLTVSLLVKEIKGSSSHLITNISAGEPFFKWQGGYAAFSVGQSGIVPLREYLQNQHSHHRRDYLRPEWELPHGDKLI